jgi:NAD(P)-dependent dehydrogenase (short-subunit alcohol dehydrogenase family)
MAKHSGKIALVTGGTGALGSVIAQRLFLDDAVVFVTYSGSDASIKGLDTLRSQHPGITGIHLDVTDESAVAEAMTDLLSRYGTVDILCNCAGGIGEKRLIEDTPFAEWEKMLTLNLHSCFLMMKYSLPAMKKHRFGRIINIAARTGITAEALKASYGVSKAGVIALTNAAAEEVNRFSDITINAIAPGIIATESNKQWGTVEEINQWVTPDQIAATITHLCSAEGVALNGQIITMYGKG